MRLELEQRREAVRPAEQTALRTAWNITSPFVRNGEITRIRDNGLIKRLDESIGLINLNGRGRGQTVTTENGWERRTRYQPILLVQLNNGVEQAYLSYQKIYPEGDEDIRIAEVTNDRTRVVKIIKSNGEYRIRLSEYSKGTSGQLGSVSLEHETEEDNT